MLPEDVEFRNFLRLLLGSPQHIVQFALYFATRGIISQLYRRIPKTALYPVNVRIRAKNLINQNKNSSLSFSDDLLGTAKHAEKLFPLRLTVLGRPVTFSSYRNFSIRSEDPEQESAFNRWYWLQDDLEGFSYEDTLALVALWLSQNLESSAPNIDTYSTCERISNLTLSLASKFEPSTFPDWLIRSTQYMAVNITKNLEYHAPYATGNHAFNNARGLFFAGRYFGIPGSAELALAIVEERLAQIITTDGFLREGSSHYHLLFLSWLKSMQQFSEKVGDQEMLQKLRKVVERAEKRAQFFIVTDTLGDKLQIPLIGDISPDRSPDILLRAFVNRQKISAADTIHSFPSSFWHRADHSNWTIFWHAAFHDGRIFPTHEHSDQGSFVLYWRNIPIIIDPGRANYLSSASMAPEWHSTVTVNGLGPGIAGNIYRYPSFYRTLRGKFSLSTDENCVQAVLEHNGFQRCSKHPISHRREWILDRASIVINDYLSTAAKCPDLSIAAETFLHFDPGVKLSKDENGPCWKAQIHSVESKSPSFRIASKHRNRVIHAQTHPHPLGWASTSYGDLQPTATMITTFEGKLPIVLSTTISVIEPSEA